MTAFLFLLLPLQRSDMAALQQQKSEVVIINLFSAITLFLYMFIRFLLVFKEFLLYKS